MTQLMMLNALSWVSDLTCLAFAAWTLPALWRVIFGRGVKNNDPLKVVALLLLSGRYSFTVVRWAYGAHREILTSPEIVGRELAFIWAVATVIFAAIVIRAYRKLA